MIIDGHAHVWPDNIARAVLAAHPAGLAPFGDGTLGGLLRAMDAAGIEMSCCLSVALEARHVRKTNEFIGALPRDRCIPFGTVHTGLTVEQNLSSLSENNIRAVKFHPNFQGLSLADAQVRELFAGLADHGILVLTHTGQGDDDAASERGRPAHLARLVESIPRLTIIAAHYGGYHALEEAERTVVGKRVLLDTSWPPTLASIGAQRVRSVIQKHGTARVVFGSDWPMADMKAEISAIRGLGLTGEELRDVLGRNLGRVLGHQEAGRRGQAGR